MVIVKPINEMKNIIDKLRLKKIFVLNNRSASKKQKEKIKTRYHSIKKKPVIIAVIVIKTEYTATEFLFIH